MRDDILYQGECYKLNILRFVSIPTNVSLVADEYDMSNINRIIS